MVFIDKLTVKLQRTYSAIVNREEWFGSSENIKGSNKDAKI